MEHSTAIGTIGGTLVSVLIVSEHTFISTAVVASIGATASFFTSLYLKWLVGSPEERAKIENAIKKLLRIK